MFSCIFHTSKHTYPWFLHSQPCILFDNFYTRSHRTKDVLLSRRSTCFEIQKLKQKYQTNSPLSDQQISEWYEDCTNGTRSDSVSESQSTSITEQSLSLPDETVKNINSEVAQLTAQEDGKRQLVESQPRTSKPVEEEIEIIELSSGSETDWESTVNSG